MVRPEAIQLEPSGLDAEVIHSSYLGSITDFHFKTAVGELTASIPGEGLTQLKKGNKVKLGFKPAGIHLLSSF